MGTASDMNVEPVGALTIGFLAGVLSTVGYAYIKVSYFLLSIAEILIIFNVSNIKLLAIPCR